MPLTSVSSGLELLATLPDWLSAAARPERIAAALTKLVPELAAGDEMLDDCDAGSFRLRDGGWTFASRVAIRGTDGQTREIALDGFLSPPGAATFQSNFSLIRQTFRRSLRLF